MNIIRIAAFSDGNTGGNPAGVHISEQHPSAAEMQSIAADVGYSETAFAEPRQNSWHVRYFSPESEVPFCGHATIALGAALARKNGPGVYSLALNNANISVEGFEEFDNYSAALQSPITHSKPADTKTVQAALKLFGYEQRDLNRNIPPAFASGGADHLIISLNSRHKLSAMTYNLDDGRTFMRDLGLVTVMLVYSETEQLFHTRNPFASGGVYEDPATGAASAAFVGYLRDINWPHKGEVNIVQGEDMGSRSLIRAELTDVPSSSIRVSGSVRFMKESG
jgi:PhzF family phenazine biosynthesis protein|tara:strand:+ start:24 stop:863 length:840 start_codon:yes stop_codon:yes gene_type:complete